MPLVKIARNGQIIGEHGAEGIAGLMTDGKVLADDYYWISGMQGWQKVSTRSWLDTDDINGPDAAIKSEQQGARPKPNKQKQQPRDKGHCCPNCGSSRIQTARAIYESGTRHSTSDGAEMPRINSKGFISGGRRRHYSSSTSQTALAQKMSPPSGDWRGCVVLLVTLFFGSVIVQILGASAKEGIMVVPGIVIVLLLAYWFYTSSWYKKNEAFEQKQKEDYERTWYCHKCGNTFVE